ncbi:MAG: hypothetical protein AAFO82_23780, partial [Bacteroidota bacterium]
IGDYWLGERKGIWLVLLLLVDPTFAAQNVLISPDAILMSCFLLGILAIIKDRQWLLVLATLGLAMVSMRGMMVVVVLYVLQIFQNYKALISFDLLLKSSFAFIPSGLLALAFLSYHYNEVGWIGYHADSPWAASFERVDFKGFLKNVVIYIWRLLDFGRVFVLLPLAALLFLRFRNRGERKQNNIDSSTKKFQFLLVLLIASIVLLSPSLLIHKYLTAHRYLLPIFFACTALLLYLFIGEDDFFDSNSSNNAFLSKFRNWKLVLYSSIFLALLTGNFWIYPPKIAQGWDATLAHLLYYKLRTEMMEYIEKEDIDFSTIGSVFPEVGARKFRELNGLEEGFSQADLSTATYIFYSCTALLLYLFIGEDDFFDS